VSKYGYNDKINVILDKAEATHDEQYKVVQEMNAPNTTSSSAIAERPHCRVG